MAGLEALDRGIAAYHEFIRLSIELGFMTQEPDGSYKWTERGEKIKNLTYDDIVRLGGAEFLASL